MTNKLQQAAQALVDRWDSPAWGGNPENLRHTGEFITALRAALANGDNLSPVGQEPFGYFKAEPFGWTDCGPDDEGAIALYESPQPAKKPLNLGEMLEQSGLRDYHTPSDVAFMVAAQKFAALAMLAAAPESPQPAKREPYRYTYKRDTGETK